MKNKQTGVRTPHRHALLADDLAVQSQPPRVLLPKEKPLVPEVSGCPSDVPLSLDSEGRTFGGF